MAAAAQILSYVVGVVALVCFIMVAIKVFQESVGMGILFVVLVFVTCGIGPFIWGWVKAKEHGTKTVMLVWTLCIIVNLILTAVVMATAGEAAMRGGL